MHRVMVIYKEHFRLPFEFSICWARFTIPLVERLKDEEVSTSNLLPFLMMRHWASGDPEQL
jgi:hypothetical protein